MTNSLNLFSDRTRHILTVQQLTLGSISRNIINNSCSCSNSSSNLLPVPLILSTTPLTAAAEAGLVTTSPTRPPSARSRPSAAVTSTSTHRRRLLRIYLTPECIRSWHICKRSATGMSTHQQRRVEQQQQHPTVHNFRTMAEIAEVFLKNIGRRLKPGSTLFTAHYNITSVISFKSRTTVFGFMLTITVPCKFVPE